MVVVVEVGEVGPAVVVAANRAAADVANVVTTQSISTDCCPPDTRVIGKGQGV